MVSYVFVRVMTMSRIKMSPFHASLQEKASVINMGGQGEKYKIKVTPSLRKLARQSIRWQDQDPSKIAGESIKGQIG